MQDTCELDKYDVDTMQVIPESSGYTLIVEGDGVCVINPYGDVEAMSMEVV